MRLFRTLHGNEIEQHAVFLDLAPLSWPNFWRRVDIAACRLLSVLPRDAHGTDRPVRAPVPLTAAYPSACHLDAMMKTVAADARLHGALLSEFDGAVRVVHGKRSCAALCFYKGLPRLLLKSFTGTFQN